MEYDWFSDSFRTNPFDQQRVASAASGIPVVEDKTPEMNCRNVAAHWAPIDTSHVLGLRDYVIIGTLAYAAARVGAVAKLKRSSLRDGEGDWWLEILRERQQAAARPGSGRLTSLAVNENAFQNAHSPQIASICKDFVHNSVDSIGADGAFSRVAGNWQSNEGRTAPTQ